MDTLSFDWSAKYGHFLRAEATVNALSYPMPPRTAVLGLLGAILGLEKDALAVDLAETRVAVSGPMPRRFWHRVKIRKDPPAALSREVKRTQRGAERPTPEKATLLNQEWLLAPRYRVHVAWPDQPDRFDELAGRIRDRRWHFTPCMGLSELLCDVEFISRQHAVALPVGRHLVQGICSASEVRVLAEEEVAVHLMRMPRHVSAERVFQHASYYLEHRGQPFPVDTQAAWRVGNWTGLFL
ncbi:CRISPR-associated protein Cas5 [Marichromatium sp. AB31]|uniref:CRISPR-associated protein Cas5 n=1 Tax=Marichromatium sp. AB31 TaxID=2483362 RepID=UPI000F3FC267|nr:CRISPR-associated protein Cas5 [Marichromatium sp. AB31]RNE91169.1 CRISPR-associated protein Cas5 [Marichromatium sp. AB31]